jgi:hypothetical protein
MAEGEVAADGDAEIARLTIDWPLPRVDPERAQKGEAVEIGMTDLVHLDAEPLLQPLCGEMTVAVAPAGLDMGSALN